MLTKILSGIRFVATWGVPFVVAIRSLIRLSKDGVSNVRKYLSRNNSGIKVGAGVSKDNKKNSE